MFKRITRKDILKMKKTATREQIYNELRPFLRYGIFTICHTEYFKKTPMENVSDGQLRDAYDSFLCYTTGRFYSKDERKQMAQQIINLNPNRKPEENRIKMLPDYLLCKMYMDADSGKDEDRRQFDLKMKRIMNEPFDAMEKAFNEKMKELEGLIK